MKEKYKWNPVYRFVMDVKRDYFNKFESINYDKKEINTETGKKTITCLENWILELKNQEYINRIAPLQINQHNNLILIRYGSYAKNAQGEEPVLFQDGFWDLFDCFYRECRSIVIDVENDNIVLCPFKKFHNLNEIEENSLDNIQKMISNAKSIEISEKLDGSMQSFTWYNCEVLGSGSQGLDKEQSWRLEDGYNMIKSQKNYMQMLKDCAHFTFIFEYISLKDAHVVQYNKAQEGMYLIGIRNKVTGDQFSYEITKEFADFYNVLTVKTFDKTLDEVMGELDKYKSNEAEGYVLNIDGHMLKIKFNDYVSIHRILSKISSVNLIIKHIADDTFDDLISKVPDAYRERVKSIAQLVSNYSLLTHMKSDQYYKTAMTETSNKKDFMLWIDKNVPKEYVCYVRNLYLKKDFSYIKSGNEKSPKYKTAKEMGIDGSLSILFGDDNE